MHGTACDTAITYCKMITQREQKKKKKRSTRKKAKQSNHIKSFSFVVLEKAHAKQSWNCAHNAPPLPFSFSVRYFARSQVLIPTCAYNLSKL